jgi:hypothetical protein
MLLFLLTFPTKKCRQFKIWYSCFLGKNIALVWQIFRVKMGEIVIITMAPVFSRHLLKNARTFIHQLAGLIDPENLC